MTPWTSLAANVPPRVLVVMPDQWPRALVRAALREVGYDAVGARSLEAALRVQPSEPQRGAVELVIVDQSAISGGVSDSAFAHLRARYNAPTTMLLARSAVTAPTGPWRRVLRRPVSVAEIVTAAQQLLPLPPESQHPLD